MLNLYRNRYLLAQEGSVVQQVPQDHQRRRQHLDERLRRGRREHVRNAHARNPPPGPTEVVVRHGGSGETKFLSAPAGVLEFSAMLSVSLSRRCRFPGEDVPRAQVSS